MSTEFAVNGVETASSETTLAILRVQTRELHAQIEASINLGAALESLQSYTLMLRRYLSIYRPFEAFLRSQDANIRNVVSQVYQSKVTLLERDLQALGAPAVDLPEPAATLPVLDSLDAVLGALYVVEGSALGGQVIYRQIQEKLNLDVHTGASFFFGNGMQTGAVWKRFISILEQHVLEPGLAVTAAAAMFRMFEHALRMTPESTGTA